MATATKTNDILKAVKTLTREVESLRRDMALIVPVESLSAYRHPKRVLASYRRATKSFPPHKGK